MDDTIILEANTDQLAETIRAAEKCGFIEEMTFGCNWEPQLRIRIQAVEQEGNHTIKDLMGRLRDLLPSKGTFVIR